MQEVQASGQYVQGLLLVALQYKRVHVVQGGVGHVQGLFFASLQCKRCRQALSMYRGCSVGLQCQRLQHVV